MLKKAATLKNEEYVFEKVHETYVEDVRETFVENTYKKVICDGYSLKFDDYLKEELGNVISGRLDIFYVDCFKCLTRNFEKILHVLQIILQNEKAFVTCNYYISNGRIERRNKILRACHYEKDMFNNIRNYNGLPPFLKSILKGMIQ